MAVKTCAAKTNELLKGCRDLKNNIAEHHLKTSHTIDWDPATSITYSIDYQHSHSGLLTAGLLTYDKLPSIVDNLFPHLKNDYSTGNSNTLYIIRLATDLLT